MAAALCLRVAVLCIVLLAASGGKNPCHKAKSLTGKDVTCNTVRLPRGMCDACSLDLDNVDEGTGDFLKCNRIYKLKTTKCRRKLNHYVRANGHCDPVRKAHVETYYDDPDALEALDYFMYSVCEQCCDCIPYGVSPNKVGALKMRRGNCPAHAVYDICTVLPRVGRFISSKQAPTTPDPLFPEMCPKLSQWISSPAAKGWNLHSTTGQTMEVPADIRKFLYKTTSAARCKKPAIWNKCYALEHRQGRV